jgi:ABC-type amino acid transport substrate-binding protein
MSVKMGKRIFVVSLFLIALAGLLLGCNKSAKTVQDNPLKVRKLIVGISPGSSGNAFYDENERLTGLEIEVLRAAVEMLPQYELEFEKVEYRSMFASLRSNRIDLVCSNLRRNAEREDFPHTYRGHNAWQNRLVVLSDNTSITGRLEDLEGFKVGTTQGTLSAIFMEDYIKRTGKKIELIYSNNTIPDLIAGRLDTYITADNLVANTNRNYKDQGIQVKTIGGPISTNEGVETDPNVYYFFAHGNEDIRNDLSDAIYELRKNGALSKFQQQFFYEDRAHLISEEEELKQMKELGRL